MSVTYVNVELRRLVLARSESLCEYCLLLEEHSFVGHQIDHVISVKHGGLTNAQNLAYSCLYCNQAKGSDVGSIDWANNEFSRFFNPRRDRWSDHFFLSGSVIESRTIIGAVTARILGFNSIDRLLERDALREANCYPAAAALRIMQ